MEILEHLKIAEKAWINAYKYAKKNITPGKDILEVTNEIESKIKDIAEIAFPLNISFNNQAAHFTPTSDYKGEIKENDVIKIDIGTHHNGYIVDAAFTIDLSKKHNDLIESSNDALEKALTYVIKEKENAILGEIGKIIENTINDYGFKPIYNLTGHSIGRYNIHSGLSIFNYNTKSTRKLGKGLFAIEPFATTGSGYIKQGNFCGIYFYNNKNTRNIYARKLINEIKQFNGLPFAERWIGKNLNSFEKKLGLNSLIKEKIITPAPVLEDIKNSLVSQHEKTIFIDEDIYIFPNIKYID